MQRQLVGERLSQVLATQASLELVSSAYRMLQTGLLAVSTLTRSLGLSFCLSEKEKYSYPEGSVSFNQEVK